MNAADPAADGLRTAMMTAVPVAFTLAAAGMALTARFVRADREAMLAG